MTVPVAFQRYKTAILAAILGSALLPALAQPPLQVNAETGETQAQFAQRTAWWRMDKFGMFIHWGVYSVPADSSKSAAEWVMNSHQMQVKDYEKYAPQFDPTKFDAKAWVKTAKDAGMKYIVITSKHHDGFCMFDSKLTTYDIVDATPWHHDPMKDLARECKRQGIKLGFYYSVMDWHHPDYLPRRDWEKETRPADGADFDRYIAYMKGQLKELLTNYGEISVIWFDGGWEADADHHHSLEVVKFIRSIQPNVIINDRINLPEDYSTPEQTIPAGALAGGRLWETCMTMNDTWGYSRTDQDWKSTTDLTRKLIDIASKGGNFLLNVGPKEDGTFPEASVERLEAVGKWTKRNGESVYGTTQSPWRRYPFDGRSTVKGNTLYIEAFSWPDDGLKLTGLKTPIKSVRLLDGGAKVDFSEELSRSDGPEAGASVAVLKKPAHLDPIATVVAVELAGPPVVEALSTVVRPESSGALMLKAPDAEILGGAQLQGEGENANIGYWTDVKDSMKWTGMLSQSGPYRVQITYSCEPGAAGSQFEVDLTGEDGKTVALKDTVESTGSWDKSSPKLLGQADLPKGKITVEVKSLTMPKYAVMNLFDVRLLPADR